MNTTDTIETKTVAETAEKTAIAKKPVLTAEERRAKRNAYAREYYKKHADKCKAACKKCRQNKKAKAAATDVQPAGEEPYVEVQTAETIAA